MNEYTNAVLATWCEGRPGGFPSMDALLASVVLPEARGSGRSTLAVDDAGTHAALGNLQTTLTNGTQRTVINGTVTVQLQETQYNAIIALLQQIADNTGVQP